MESKNERLTIALPGKKRVLMAFRKITKPADGFMMGSRGNYYREEPVHRVSPAQDYWMAETPVTQAQFAVWTRAESIEHKNEFPDNPLHPAENITWGEANAYCQWITKNCSGQFATKKHMACLPTEAEWEYACRAGTETEYYTGDGEVALAEAGWYDGNSGDTTKPVGLLTANEFGLYDMHGNVWEWCHDVWDASTYRKRADGDRDPGSVIRIQDWRNGIELLPGDHRVRVLRGGSGYDTALRCRSAFRLGNWIDERFRVVGFRVCLVPGPSAETSSDPTEETAEATGDGGRGTRPKSQGAHAKSKDLPDLSSSKFPRVAGKKFRK